MTAPHLSVLLSEVVEALAPAPGKLIVDGTFGAGGYSRAFLQAGAKVIAFDRDPTVAPFVEALSAEFPGALRFIGRPFSELADGLADAGETACDGLALDIGVSSMQIDQAARGFSFQNDGPLDMRMSADGPTAADLINNEDEVELARIFYELGEERASRGIARALVRRRAETPFTRTLDLADAVERAVGGRRGAPIHPATRVFQALRIAVNDELGELTAALRAAESHLRPGGRLAVVSFHSLEDRIVKSFLTERSGALPQGSRHAPAIAAKAAPTFTLLQKKAVTAQDAETWRNPRARSAKLRAAIRTEAPAWRVAA